VDAAVREGSRIISFTYTDPVVFYEYVYDTAKLARGKGIKSAIVTAGYIAQEPLRELCKVIDAATVDIKGPTEGFYRRFNTAKLQPVLDALVTMKKAGVWVEVSYLVIPGENDSDADFGWVAGWIRDNLGAGTPFHLLRFFPMYRLLSKPPTPKAVLERGRDIARKAGLKYVYIGNVPDSVSAEDTFCPKCGKKVVERDGWVVRSIGLKDGTCAFCGARIDGVWK
jgi:pyruvate formate lyase activating enzyme